MQTAKQVRHSSFQHGQGAFACRNCQRKTRDTGDNGQVQMCPECYELAGLENALSDSGEEVFKEAGYVAVASEQLASLANHIGIERAEALHPEMASLVHASDTPVEQPITQEAITAYSVAVAGNVKGEAYSELILVNAPAARFARRIARAQLREAGIDTTNLVFNARIVR